MTWFRFDEDCILMFRKKMLVTFVMALGGRAVEELIFDDITLGASNDIEQVTRMARSMVTRLGMSAELGTMTYGQKEEMIFLGREISEQRNYSEAVAEQIDREVRKIVEDAYKQAKALVKKYRKQLDLVAKKLIEVESINREDFEVLFPAPAGKKKSGTPQVA